MNADVSYRELLPDLIRREAKPLHKYGHQARLYELAKEIGAGMAYDDDVVFAAIWLHDIGVFEGNRPADEEKLRVWDHVKYAVTRTTDVLVASDFPAAKISRVVEVIEEHQPKDEPTSVEAVIVRDADILEQLGAITIFRSAAKLGSDTRFIYFADARNSLERQLKELPEKLKLERSRELAAPRIKILSEFIAALDLEAGKNLG